MPRLYSFTIGRRNRDAAVQSVRVAATRQPQTALEQSEKAYLYSLVVSSAGYREGQPPQSNSGYNMFSLWDSFCFLS